MTARQCSLRNFDRRRKIQKDKDQQPLIVDDNEVNDSDRLSMESVRNLYIDPEEVDIKPDGDISYRLGRLLGGEENRSIEHRPEALENYRSHP